MCVCVCVSTLCLVVQVLRKVFGVSLSIPVLWEEVQLVHESFHMLHLTYFEASLSVLSFG